MKSFCKDPACSTYTGAEVFLLEDIVTGGFSSIIYISISFFEIMHKQCTLANCKSHICLQLQKLLKFVSLQFEFPTWPIVLNWRQITSCLSTPTIPLPAKIILVPVFVSRGATILSVSGPAAIP